MSVPSPGVLAGYTNGTITTFDHTIELAAITTALGTLNATLLSLFGTPGAAIPGTVANSAMLTKDMLVIIQKNLQDIKNNNEALMTAIVGMQGSIDGLSQTMAAAAVIHGVGVADQIENNSFEQTATKEALKRNDLPEPSVPSPVATIKEKVQTAAVLHEAGVVTASVTSFTNNMISQLSSYITNSGPVKYAKSAISTAFSSFTDNLTSFLPKPSIKPEDLNAKLTRSGAQLGTKVPFTDLG
jgi:hypothetical protein